jgi:two-component system chemotaxis response regulator CheY
MKSQPLKNILKGKEAVFMRILIAEDDYVSRKFLFKFLSDYGDCDLTVDGMEALDAFMMAIKEKAPYDLVCLDIMMPKLDGVKTLKGIRDIERKEGVKDSKRCKIIMTTALNDVKTINKTYDQDCEAFAVKPINTEKFLEVMRRLGLIK